MKKWYKSWFDSPYYHILYRERNDQEAHLFLDNLIHFLKPKKSQLFLDIACGKGRHAYVINKKGFHVEGIDLSQENINAASQFTSKSIQFRTHDMREVYKKNHFDYVLNLFTSFGYFESYKENELAMNAITKNLKKGGKLIIDFMNSKKIISNLVSNETKQIDNITFDISRKLERNYIIKNIDFKDNNQTYRYTEKVYGFTLSDFDYLMSSNGMKILNLWGNYSLNDFDVTQSPRLIILAQKWN